MPNATILTPAQISYYAQQAGFDGADLVTAVAIALAESSGNPNVYNPEIAAGTPAGQGSYGLWQIYLKDHPEFGGDNLYDPQTNANDAYETYRKAGGFHPWASYNSGAYQAYVAAASSATEPAPAMPGLTWDEPVAMSGSGGLSLNEFLWIGGAILVGWALFSFLE